MFETLQGLMSLDTTPHAPGRRIHATFHVYSLHIPSMESWTLAGCVGVGILLIKLPLTMSNLYVMGEFRQPPDQCAVCLVWPDRSTPLAD
jgi:hypothetical protein